MAKGCPVEDYLKPVRPVSSGVWGICKGLPSVQLKGHKGCRRFRKVRGCLLTVISSA